MELRPGYKQTEAGVIPDEWEARCLVNLVVEIGDGIHSTPEYVRLSEFYFINGNNLIDGKIAISDNTMCVSEAEYLKLRKKLNDKTILLSINGTIGNLAFFNGEKVVLGKSAAYINVASGISKEYIFYSLRSAGTLKYFENELTGTTIRNLSLASLRNTPVPIPNFEEEQRAIATALSDIDALIAGLDQLIAKKRDIKQAAMQQLLTGKLRLSGFSGGWERKTFGDLFQILNTANNPRADLSDFGDIGYIHYGDIHTSSSAFFNFEKIKFSMIAKERVAGFSFVENGDVVMADASEDYAGIGKSVEIQNIGCKKIVAGLHTFLLRGNKDMLADGFKGYLQFMPDVKAALVRFATGISVYGVSKNNVRSIEIRLPAVEEQRAISNVLSDMDAEIAALEQKRDKTRALKQGMMQELLTGRIRLI